MSGLSISLRRGKDSKDLLVITRPDGTSTWSREQQGFLAFHDLAHFVVESTLGMRNGFYGLISQGWDITTFGEKAKAKTFPKKLSGWSTRSVP